MPPHRHRYGRRPRPVDEGLEILWMNEERGSGTTGKDLASKIGGPPSEKVLRDLLERGLAVKEEDRVEFTPEGRRIAGGIIRRHRLAERLLADVLDVGNAVLERSACEFEHLLAPEVETSICTLLGHPRFCPHNLPIPEGDCCRVAQKELRPVIRPLGELSPGQEGRVAYIATGRHLRLDQLSSIGILPGVIVHVHQTRPAFVVMVGETAIALDETFVKDIFVRCA